jgi:hypothetical protein
MPHVQCTAQHGKLQQMIQAAVMQAALLCPYQQGLDTYNNSRRRWFWQGKVVQTNQHKVNFCCEG